MSYKCVGIFKKSNDLLNLSTEVISFIIFFYLSLSNLKQSFIFILTPNFNQKNIYLLLLLLFV